MLPRGFGFLAIFTAWTVAGHAVASPVTVEILSATVKDERIAGATAILQRNGAESVKATTAANGSVTLNSATEDNADTLLIVQKPGYSNLVVRCPCNGLTYALSPVIHGLDGMRVVLNWGAEPADLVFVPNATAGVNTVLRSRSWTAWDELLVTDHEYNACRNALDFVAHRSGARVVVAPVPFPCRTVDEIVTAVNNAPGL